MLRFSERVRVCADHPDRPGPTAPAHARTDESFLADAQGRLRHVVEGVALIDGGPWAEAPTPIAQPVIST